MNEHINIFFDIMDKLKEMDMEVADDLLLILLLYRTPENNENFRCAIEAQDELPKPDALKIQLLEEWETRKGKGYPQHQNAYNSSESKQNFQEQKKNDKQRFYFNRNIFAEKTYKILTWNYCSKVGLKALECRKKMSDKKKHISK